MSQLPWGEYLKRVRYNGEPKPTRETLAELVLRHGESIPFENLDIHDGVQIHLDESKIFQKIVERGRGGFCYELNGLFAGLLRWLGFSVSLHASGIYIGDGQFSQDGDHLVLNVDLDGQSWLVDVGYGYHLVEPTPIPGQFENFSVEADSEYCVLRMGGEPVYRFRSENRPLEYFVSMSEYHQTDKQSPLKRTRFCMIQEGSRVTKLIGDQLEIKGESIDEQRKVDDAEIGKLFKIRY